MFHIQYNKIATGGAVANLDIPAVADPSFSTRNGHYIYSEEYELLAAAPFGPTITALQNNTPHMTWINPPQIYPVSLSTTVPTNVAVCDLRENPWKMPINEEWQWGVTDGASENVTLVTWLGTPSWSRRMPPAGIQRLTIPFTASMVTTAFTWCPDVQLAPSNQLRGGTYAVIGADVIGAASQCFRFNFTRQPLSRNRKLYPGSLCTQTYGLIPNKLGQNWMGLYGYFNTFELPYISVVANASATVTHTVYLDVWYMSNSTDALDQYIAASW